MLKQHLLPHAALLLVGLLLLPLLHVIVQAQSAALTLSTPRLVFSAVQGTTSAVKQVTITNTGGTSLSLGTPTITGDDAAAFVLDDDGGLPRALAPNESLSVGVRFSPAAGAANSPNDPALAATLSIAVSGDEPLHIGLAGLALRGLSGTLEPSLQQIFDGYQLSLDVADPDPYTSALGRSALQWGDEVPAQQLRKAGPGPVTVEVVAVFGPAGDDEVARFGWYPVANPATRNELFVVPKTPANNNATLQPQIAGLSSFDPGNTPFGIYSLWPFFDASGTAPRSQGDALNSWESNLTYRHKVRVYPLRSTALGDEPNAYVLATEEQSGGQDYQDIVVILRNVQPVPPTLSFEFDRSYPGTLIDRNGQPIGFISTQQRLNPPDTIAATSSYDPTRIALDSSGAGSLVVTTTQTSSAQGAAAGWNNLINALQVPFDGSAPFTVTTRLLGPLDNITADTQQAGIFFGPSQTTYAKLVAARLDGRNVIEFRNEIDDVERGRATISLDANGGLANIAALELTITVDPATREMRASYRKELISGGVESASFSNAITVPVANATEYFNVASQAGLTFSARGAEDIQTSFRFDRFAVNLAPGTVPTATVTPTQTPSQTPTLTPSQTPTHTTQPNVTNTATATASGTAQAGATHTPTATASSTAQAGATNLPTAMASGTATPTGEPAPSDEQTLYLPLIVSP